MVRVVGVLLGAILTVPALAGDIVGQKWMPLGPQPGCCFFAGGETGRATAVAPNPIDPDDIWLGTAGGGVWHSADGGQSWWPMTDDKASLAIGAIAVAGCTAPLGCARVYAGTGENAIRRDTYYGAGLLVGTRDLLGGYGWVLRDGGPDYDFTHGAIQDVVLDPTTSGSGQVLYIALSSGVTASAAETTVTAPPPSPGGYGIYKSSTDGASWTRLIVSGSEGGSGNGRPTDLEIDPVDPQVLYAGFLGRGIFKTVDGGSTWCPLQAGIPKPQGCPGTVGLPNAATETFDHVEIALDPSDRTHLAATFGRCPDPLFKDCEPSVYVSADAGATWTMKYAGTTDPTFFGDLVCPSAYTRYMHGLAFSPSDRDTLFLGAFHLCKSETGGQHWFQADTNTKGKGLHPDHRAIVFHPTQPSRVYDVNDGGIALSTDGGATWTPSVSRLGTVQFQSLATSPHTPDVIGGTQDNAGMLWTGSQEWTYLPCCGDGGFSVMDRNVLQYLYITSNVDGILANFKAVPIRSLDGGKTFPSPGTGTGYDHGIDDETPRSFYPPMFEDPAGTVWFGTNKLWSSGNALFSFTERSPVLSADPFDEIVSGVDVVTAMAEAPSSSSRMYLGYYSGKVFVSDGPCSSPSCWELRNTNLPAAPITWLAVDPLDRDVAYATLSGFFPGVHVYKTTNGGLTWNATGSLAELDGEPANTILVYPSNGNRLLLGTDHGIYRSDNGGGAWYRFGFGLPNVAVYAIVLDDTRGRTFAATHGRGAYLLYNVFSKVYGLIKRQKVLVEKVHGGGFRPNQACAVQTFLTDGSVCASSSTDVLGGAIHTDGGGFLVASKSGSYDALPMVRLAGCAGVAAATVAGVRVVCGDQRASETLRTAVARPGPPASPLSLTLPAAGTSGAFELLPSVQSGDGSTRALCAVPVPFTAADTEATVLARAAQSVQQSAACAVAGVGARVDPGQDHGEVEDRFARPGALVLEAPEVVAEALVPAIRFAPGQATGWCLRLQGVDDPLQGALRGAKVRFETGPGGAAGGTAVLTERAGLGECTVRVPIAAGASAGQVAAAVAAAFQAEGIPGPHPDCPAWANLRDVVRQGDAVLTSMASELVVCVQDAGLGVALSPDEICVADAECDDASPCTDDQCDPQTHACVSSPLPNGTPCEDGDACTLGGACLDGTCGSPVSCADADPCTRDRCLPATGGCAHEAVVCDDGNPCTADVCSAATGGCVSTPIPGGTCSDGDLCTVGDVCVQPPGSPLPTCQGQPACADADPCTADLCDPDTGACQSDPIACEDGNPCTLDACQGGTCIATSLSGSCDDDDRCTTGDTCVAGPSGPVCSGSAVPCDDADPCTVDACDEVTGGCMHRPLAIASVGALVFPGDAVLTWPASPGALAYRTYRGTIGALDGWPAGTAYDHTCFERDDALGDGELLTTDPTIPAAGTGFYYLVAPRTSCGEGPPGADSNGTPIPNGSPCLP